MKPALAPTLPPSEFNAWYWLKAELQAFCSQQGLPTTGSKEDLHKRVHTFLAGDPLEAVPPAPARQRLPAVLTPHTEIQPGWPLGPQLRAFFEQHVGPGFRFNQVLRDLFKAPHGNTLAHALALYRASLAHGARAPIARQFQFNQHMRDYFLAHPKGTRDEAIAQWEHKKRARGALGIGDAPPV